MEQQPERGPYRAIGLLVTNLGKLLAFALAVNEALIRDELRPIVIGIAALFYAGVQALETFVDKLLGR